MKNCVCVCLIEGDMCVCYGVCENVCMCEVFKSKGWCINEGSLIYCAYIYESMSLMYISGDHLW